MGTVQLKSSPAHTIEPAAQRPYWDNTVGIKAYLQAKKLKLQS